jgi:hypothetical protein
MHYLRIFTTTVIGSALLASPLLASAAGLYGSVNAHVGSTTAGISLEARITNGRNRADQEIKRRVDALTELSTRISNMKHVPDSDKASLSASIQNQISDLASLQTKIDADTDLATLKTDIQSITKSYRIFLLVLPQSRITAAGDRIADVAASLATLAGKLQARISATTGDTTALSASLADMNAKVADATTQSAAAIAEVTPLAPDNGNATVQASNTAALKDARTKIEASMKDLIAARKDAGDIVKGLKELSKS